MPTTAITKDLLIIIYIQGGFHMKFMCSKQILLEGINIVKAAVSTKTTLSILEGILVKTNIEDNSITLIGNDLEIGIEYTLEADIQSQGSIVIEARLFSEIIRNFGESQILIELKENNIINLECENAKFEIKGTSSDSYPLIQTFVPENTVVIKQKTLKEMINQTIFAVSADENRRILTGSLIECRNKQISIVSIDNKKMALRNNSIDSNSELQVVVPGKTLKEISRIIQANDQDISINVTHNQILFAFGKCKISARLLEGEFFNYKSIISKDFEASILIDRKMLYDAVKRASLVTLEENRYPIIIDIKDDFVTVKSNSNLGSVEDQIKADFSGKEMSIAFNPFYIMETLNSIEDSRVNMFFVTELGPCIIKPVVGQEYTYLIASVRK